MTLSPENVTALITVASTLVGVVLTGLLSLKIATKTSSKDLAIAKMQADRQIKEIRERSGLEERVERRKQHRADMEVAFGAILEWMHDVETQINEVTNAIFSGCEEGRFEELCHLVRDWSFDFAREPRGLVRVTYLLSDQVQKEVQEFRLVALNFSRPAELALRAKSGELGFSNRTSHSDGAKFSDEHLNEQKAKAVVYQLEIDRKSFALKRRLRDELLANQEN